MKIFYWQGSLSDTGSFFFIFIVDPISVSPGSARTALALSGTETQHVPLRQLLILPYVVFPLRSVTRRAAAENSASLIP